MEPGMMIPVAIQLRAGDEGAGEGGAGEEGGESSEEEKDVVLRCDESPEECSRLVGTPIQFSNRGSSNRSACPPTIHELEEWDFSDEEES